MSLEPSEAALCGRKSNRLQSGGGCECQPQAAVVRITIRFDSTATFSGDRRPLAWVCKKLSRLSRAHPIAVPSLPLPHYMLSSQTLTSGSEA